MSLYRLLFVCFVLVFQTYVFMGEYLEIGLSVLGRPVFNFIGRFPVVLQSDGSLYSVRPTAVDERAGVQVMRTLCWKSF